MVSASRRTEEVKAKEEEIKRRLITRPDVAGVSIRRASEPVVTVYMRGHGLDPATLASSIPSRIGGMKVIIRDIGDVRLLPMSSSYSTLLHSPSSSPPPSPSPYYTAASSSATSIAIGSFFSVVSSMLQQLLQQQQEQQSDTVITRNRFRPLLAGISISPLLSNLRLAGTAGLFLPLSSEKALLVTNAHVLSPSNPMAAPPSSSPSSSSSSSSSSSLALIQPGSLDNGTDSDIISRILSWHPLSPEENTVDLGIAVIESTSDANASTPAALTPFQLAIPVSATETSSSTIIMYSTEYYDDTLREGDLIHKIGRTTGYTAAKVIDANATIKVIIGDDANGTKEVIFNNVILTEKMAESGDSGAAGFTVRADPRAYAISTSTLPPSSSSSSSPSTLAPVTPLVLLPAGLLFAGSNEVSIFARMDNVIRTLKTAPELVSLIESAGITVREAGFAQMKPYSSLLAAGGGATTDTTTVAGLSPIPPPISWETIMPWLTLIVSGVQIAAAMISISRSSSSSSSNNNSINNSNSNSNSRDNSRLEKEERRGAGGENKGRNTNTANHSTTTSKSSCSLCRMLQKVKEEGRG